MLQAALHFSRYGSLIDADWVSALDRYSWQNSHSSLALYPDCILKQVAVYNSFRTEIPPAEMVSESPWISDT